MAYRQPKKDLTGKKFGRLTVLGPAGQSSNRSWTSRCICECGQGKTALNCSLLSGKTQSCGCLLVETRSHNAKLVHKHNTKHGLSHTPEYKAWREMVDRCANPRCKSYLGYGGRGIQVCEQWLEFENFVADMGQRPSSDFSLDRKDNDGDYTPGNCRWATRSQQMNNMRSNRFITFDGERKTISQWARETGIGKGTITARLNRGWSDKEAICGR